ncbi:hypothetical protein BDY17DRAFT_247433, partial [Neohortaea acidophila]
CHLNPTLEARSIRRDSMTDTSHPVPILLGHDHTSHPLQPNGLGVDRAAPVAPLLDDSPEDDGQISCICGYPDDDGWTVQCDDCNRWQHQVCYYPEYEDRSLPDDLQHYCLDCRPRAFDHESARVRQKIKREEQASEVNGMKRAAPKSHKKKVKEPAYTNGWPLDKARHDRNSASPRDQPPPAKRPKTSHRPSDSTATVTSTKGHSRKRNASTANHRRSVSNSPEFPSDLYSEHFIRCYMNDWIEPDSNCHASTDVSNALSDWLLAPDDDFKETHGRAKGEILWRYDGDLEDMSPKAVVEQREEHDERVKDADGNHPTWKWLTVREPIATNAFIGELKGYVGFREDYIQDPLNRWASLRHPEPFVFFHSQLPIYVDARNEGTQMRYVRRSCQPNAKLQVLVTDSRDYRFCFIATTQIDPGTEISVAWEAGDSIPGYTHDEQNPMSEAQLEQMNAWVSNVLTNCGPCGCHRPVENCFMARLDRRGMQNRSSMEVQPVKVGVKSKKRAKSSHYMSPLNTNLNSRSGSEARRVDGEDEPSESRSASGSAGRDSASRDITPNSHYLPSAALPKMSEMSERERKKLAKEEAMFKKQEEEMTGKHGKKKRHSGGGSNAQTPNPTSSKQPAASSKYADVGTAKQLNLPSKPGRKPKGSTARSSPARAAAKAPRRPKPNYVDASVQCDREEEPDMLRLPSSEPRRPYISTTQRLLQRCALNNARANGPQALAEAERQIKEDEKMELDSVASQQPVKSASPARDELEPTTEQAEAQDVEMKDVNVKDSQPTDTETASAPSTLSAPPPASEPLAPSALHHQRPPDMHLQMPPPPTNPFSTSAPSSAISTTATTPFTNANNNATILQSPLVMTPGATAPIFPLFSPSVTAAVNPSPAKKKLSLSDYTRRTKATKDGGKDGGAGGLGEVKSERESSPASSVVEAPGTAPSSATTVEPPVLLPTASEMEKADENAVEDGGEEGEAEQDPDVKMEDAGAAAAASTADAAVIDAPAAVEDPPATVTAE